MECTGKFIGIQNNPITNECSVVFRVNEPQVFLNEYDKLSREEKLSIEVKKYRKKRSLDANNYFHVLVGKIADTLTISKAKCKNILICKYGQPVVFEDGEFLYYKTNAPVEYIIEQEEPHLIFVSNTPDGMNMFKQYRGSHTYDTKEMSVLIDGTVADAKELGIETLTPDQLTEMKERWHL
jgi:hypothetical protein